MLINGRLRTEISLIRHGKSKCTENSRMTYSEFKEWAVEYDNKGVFEENSYHSETLKKITTATIIMSSDLKRSMESVKYLNPNAKAISTQLFREVELPVPLKNIFGFKSNS